MTAPRVIAVTRKYHGLGNRMRVVLSAASLSEWSEREFSYVWPHGKWFGARFQDLWVEAYQRTSALSARALALRHPYLAHDADWLDERTRADRVWLVRTAHALELPAAVRPWGELLRRLTPVGPVAERIHALHDANFGSEPYLGVMVRSHPVSHEQTREASPISWYVDRLDEIVAERPGTRMFVSADSADAASMLANRYPGAVTVAEKGRYNSLDALRAAVVDLYILAGSTHLIGPHFSSFPELAQQLAGPRLTLETSRTDVTRRWAGGAPMSVVPDPLVPSAARPG